ncbi:flagellar export protein FliJ [Candidatus Berkiella cookevillensis]|uniref:Flagellar FliJ protein n=1 Tax=Candidatus Berkiella cookevillensis TaxID=437022 RepID=A0A0Q9YS89_9GAMM|nr:flagellar FliJ family protein [Candidatus Berkiella cookevillensis]MCS5708606.1 flagellar export protein FliJ [Candidatus Berkiella cookevillensis]
MSVIDKYKKLKAIWDRNLGFIIIRAQNTSAKIRAEREKIALLESYLSEYTIQDSDSQAQTMHDLKLKQNFSIYLRTSIIDLGNNISKLEQELQYHNKLIEMLHYKISQIDKLIDSANKEIQYEQLKMESKNIEELFRNYTLHNHTS